MMHGARFSRSNLISRLRHWQQDHHRQSVESFAKIIKHPTSSLLTMLVIALALALPAILMTLLLDSQNLLKIAQHQSFITLYVSDPESDAVVQNKLQSIPGIDHIRIQNADASLRSFEDLTGTHNTVTLLGHNPLPTVLTIYPSNHDLNGSGSLELALHQRFPHAELAMDIQWLKRLDSALEILRRLFWILFSGMSAAVVLVISNTIRLTVESRKDEIILLKLLGATHRMVRRPFLYTGFWFGLCGGVFSSILVIFSLVWLNIPIHQMAELYQAQFQLPIPRLRLTLILALTAAFFGILGAYLALFRHLRTLNPR